MVLKKQRQLLMWKDTGSAKYCKRRIVKRYVKSLYVTYVPKYGFEVVLGFLYYANFVQ